MYRVCLWGKPLTEPFYDLDDAVAYADEQKRLHPNCKIEVVDTDTSQTVYTAK